MDVLTSPEPGRDDNLLLDLFGVLVITLMHCHVSVARYEILLILIGFFTCNIQAQTTTLEGLVRLRHGQWEPIVRLRRPLQDFLEFTFTSASSPSALQEQTTERLLSQVRPHIQNLLASEENVSGRSTSPVDLCATTESLITRHIRDILKLLFDNG